MLGFIPSEFIGIEQEADFTLMAGYLSGRPPAEVVLNLQLRHGNSGMPYYYQEWISTEGSSGLSKSSPSKRIWIYKSDNDPRNSQMEL